jgi:hypothetical protein
MEKNSLFVEEVPEGRLAYWFYSMALGSRRFTHFLSSILLFDAGRGVWEIF